MDTAMGEKNYSIAIVLKELVDAVQTSNHKGEPSTSRSHSWEDKFT